ELARFALGNLPREAFARVADHVARCAACEANLQALEAARDPFLDRLGQAAANEEVAVAPVPHELLAAARSVRQKDRRSAWLAAGGVRRLGKFELVEDLGVGSFGHVFRARDTELGRSVAIKILRAGRLASHEDVDRFLREARSAAQLKHPGLVALYET